MRKKETKTKDNSNKWVRNAFGADGVDIRQHSGSCCFEIQSFCSCQKEDLSPTRMDAIKLTNRSEKRQERKIAKTKKPKNPPKWERSDGVPGWFRRRLDEFLFFIVAFSASVETGRRAGVAGAGQRHRRRRQRERRHDRRRPHGDDVAVAEELPLLRVLDGTDADVVAVPTVAVVVVVVLGRGQFQVARPALDASALQRRQGRRFQTAQSGCQKWNMSVAVSKLATEKRLLSIGNCFSISSLNSSRLSLQ